MKTKIFIFFILVFNTLFYQSQNTGITYQALIINPQGEMVPGYNNISAPLANKDICMRFSIYDSSNQAEYVETIKTTTDKSGIVNLIIGTGSKVGGYATSFSGVLWDKNLKRLKVEFDVNANCSDYLEISNQTFSYVPFAYYSSSTKEATATTTGSVQLAGDLAGVGSTAKSPKITDGAITSSKLANGAIINSKIGEIISVNNGGTGNSNIIGYVVGNGTNAMTGVTSIPVTDVDGAQTVSNMDADIATSTDPENKYPSVKAVKNYIGNSIAVSTIPDASTTAKGKLQLSGDLSGTADSPSIALGAVNNSKLADDAVTASKIKDGEITDAKIANGISASKVGLGNVNNTSDTSKPISTLQQAALDLKENLSNKSTDITADATSTTKYPAVKTIKDYVDDAIASATIADADATTKGKLQLAGDLTGSAASPAIAAGAVTTAKIANTAVTDDKIDTVSGSKITGNIPGNAENVNGIVSIANGGTGSSTQNFVDLSTDQTIAGAKTFNSDIIANGVKVGKGSGNGDSNVAVGTDLGSGTGYRNTGVGAGALQNFSGTSFGNNTGIGYANMQGLTTGYGNTSLGGETLASVANNDNNTAIGNQTLRNAASSNNTALGANAGNAVTTGSGNTLLGSQADLGTGTNSNATAIGYGAVVNGDNTIQLGNTNITSVKTSGKLTTGTVTYPNTNGTGSQFLKTDGNGHAEWADLPAIDTANLVNSAVTDDKIASGISASKVGLGNVNNTADADKPISTAQQTALDLKENLSNKSTNITTDAGSSTKYPTVKAIKDYVDTLNAAAGVADGSITSAKIADGTIAVIDIADNAVETAKIKDANVTTGKLANSAVTNAKIADAAVTDDKIASGISASKVGLENVDNTADADKPVSTAQQTALDLKANLESPTFTGTVSGVTKAMVGLGNVDNTADADKPVSTDQQAALDLKANLESPTFTGTVSGVTKAMVGLGNVNNTADADKPVSTNQQTALDLKANLESPTFTGTVSGVTKAMVGLGNVDNTADADKPVSTDQQTALDLKANLESPTFTGTVSGVTKAMVGLGNVDNTADTNKPVSTAQQTALDLKANLESPTFTGTVSGVTKAMVGLGNVDNTADADKPVSILQKAALDLKENLSNKSTNITTDADSSTKYPTVKAIKDYVDTLNAAAGVANGSITSAKIADGTIAVIDIADNAVETSKIKDLNITTAKLADANVTYAKIQNVSATDKVLGRVSANAGVIEEISTTGSGNVVRATSPTLVTPTLGVATATSVNKLTITAPSTGSTLTIADGKTLTANNSIILAGTDGKTMTFPSTDATIARTDAAQTFTGTQTFSSTIAGSISGNAATVTNGIYTTSKISDLATTTSSELSGKIFDETGSGALVFANTPTLVTPNIGAATGTSLSVSGQLTSTVATGTAPLVVTSTTPVANLSIGGNAATATTATNIAGGAAGSLPYQSAADTTALLAKGTDGQVLSLSGGVPKWTNNIGGGVLSKSASYNISATDSANYLIFSGSTASQTIQLPSAEAAGSGREITIKNVSSVSLTINTAANATVTGGGYLISDSTTTTANSLTIGIEPSNNWIKAISDGKNWYILRALF